MKVPGILQCCASVRRHCDVDSYDDDDDGVSKGHWFHTSYISRKYVGCSHKIALLEYELEPSPNIGTCFLS